MAELSSDTFTYYGRSMTYPVDRYDASIRAHQQAIERLTAEQAKREKFGPDDFADETVLYFTKVFNDGSMRYTYVAFKIAGAWYLSGREGARWTWNQLVDFMLDSDQLWMVSEWERIF